MVTTQRKIPICWWLFNSCIRIFSKKLGPMLYFNYLCCKSTVNTMCWRLQFCYKKSS